MNYQSEDRRHDICCVKQFFQQSFGHIEFCVLIMITVGLFSHVAIILIVQHNFLISLYGLDLFRVIYLFLFYFIYIALYKYN